MFDFFRELLALYVLLNFIQYFVKAKKDNFVKARKIIFLYAFAIKAGFYSYTFNTGKRLIDTSFISPLERLIVNHMEDEYTVFIPLWAPYFITKNNYRKYFNPNYNEYNEIKKYQRECQTKVGSCISALHTSVEYYDRFKSDNKKNELKEIMIKSYRSSKKRSIMPSCDSVKPRLKTYQKYIKILNLKKNPYDMLLDTHVDGVGKLITKCRGKREPGLSFIVELLVGINDLNSLENITSYSCSEQAPFKRSCSTIINTISLIERINNKHLASAKEMLKKVCSKDGVRCPSLKDW